MKIIIFAGGVGTRLWPLSRKNTPKQFEKIVGDTSTLQQTVQRLLPEFKPGDIHIATGERYKEIVRSQLPEIPEENFIFEPEMRDVGPAIALAASIFEKRYGDEPMAILWSDHMIKNVDRFRSSLRIGENIIDQKKSDFVFIAQKPRFANQNMGWIEVGEKIPQFHEENVDVYSFKRLIYRPKLEDAVEYARHPSFVWNLGYFVTRPPFLVSLFKRYAPEMYSQIETIASSFGTESYEKTLHAVYSKVEKISFDDVILVKLSSDNNIVISSDLGWSDIGAWEALKEALSENQSENVTHGNVMLQESTDCLAFNYANQMIVGIDLSEMLVINTNDVLLVCPKASVPKIKKFVENLSGTPLEHLT